MTIGPTAPGAQEIVRDEEEEEMRKDDHNGNTTTGGTRTDSRNNTNDLVDDVVMIEPLSEQYFNQARNVENEFLGGTGKGCCFGICQYSHCPASKDEFESIYRKDPDRCQTYAVAIRRSTLTSTPQGQGGGEMMGEVIGVICLRQNGQKAKWDEDMVHTPQPNEMYIDHLAVTKHARGLGVGTKLLQWGEDIARQRNKTLLTLGVVKGNPAKRLYQRLGFVDVSFSCFWSSCIVGMPHGQFGADMMEKELV